MPKGICGGAWIAVEFSCGLPHLLKGEYTGVPVPASISNFGLNT